MQRKLFIKFHRLGILAVFGLFASISFGLIEPADVSATSCEDGSISCISVQFGKPVGERTVDPSSNVYSATQFYLPVTINIQHDPGYTVDYTVKVYGSGNKLVSKDNANSTIPSVLQNTSYNDLGKNGSEWGIRWNFGDTVTDSYSDYHPVPASSSDASSLIVSDGKMDKNTKDITKQLTLGFAVAVDGNQASGSYTNTVTVAVVASPKDARTIFDISTMQEMTTEICKRTTTPVKANAMTQYDTDGSHAGDVNYVPETTLADTRDNKTYLVRKLADGSCWMSQNLSFDIVAGQELTNRTTDLNSKRSWVPTNSTQTVIGEVEWGRDDGADWSISYQANTYWTGYSGDTAFTAEGSPVGYGQRGNYYNWFAATAGSGRLTDVKSTTDGNRIIAGVVQDSICPKGWTLPVGGETAVGLTDGSAKSFYNLVQIYTGKTGSISSAMVYTLYAAPMHFVPAGYYATDSFYGVGDRQLYWSSTAYTLNNAWQLLYMNPTSTVYPGTGHGSMASGLSVRCVAR